MATIQQTIALIDGVTPVLNKITNSASKVINKFKTTAKAATGMEQSAAAGARGVESAVNRVKSSFGNLGSELRGIGGSIKTALSGTLGQFTVGNLLASGIERAVSAAAQLPGRLLAASDAYAGIQARLRLVAGGAEQAAELNQRIYESAQRSRGSYDQMADSVSKIAMTAKAAFPDPKDVVPFMEGIQKLFVIGGTDAEQQRNALLQLTQALGSGRLQGDEFRSIAEAAPLIEKMVAQYMGVTQGELKALSSQGEVTAEVIKGAILSNLQEINQMFTAMGTTWQQRMTIVANAGQWAMQTVYKQLNVLANSKAGETIMNGLVQAINIAVYAIEGLVNNVVWLGSVISRNWDIIAPILLLMASYYIGIGAAALVSGMQQVASNAMVTGAKIAHMVATMNLATAQWELNAAFLACPVTWIVGAIAAVIAVIYLAVAIVNHFAGTSISATGIIFAAFAVLFNAIRSQVVFFMNMFLIAAQFIADVWRNPMAAVYNLFADIWNNILELVGSAVNSIIEMIRAIPGMDKVIGGEPIDITKTFHLDRENIEGSTAPSYIKYYTVAEAASYGYGLGNGIGDWAPEFNIPDGATGNNSGIEKALDGIGGDAGDTADNTGRMAEAMEITDEELKYLRDFAEQEAINKYTTAEVKIDMGGISNNISSDVDVDGMMTYINDSLISAMQAGAEEVHP